MNAKKSLIIITLLIIAIVSVILGSTISKASTSAVAEQCTPNNPVGCDEIIAELQREHEDLQDQQNKLNKKANVYRAINDLNSTGSVEIVDEKLN